MSAICHLLRIPFRLRPFIPPNWGGEKRGGAFNAPSSILIIKPCCLGDVLMATPVIAALRQTFPKARIDFAVGDWARAMVENNPHLDGLLDCGPSASRRGELVEPSGRGPVGSGGRYSWREYFDLARRIRAARYEACFVLDRSPLISLLPYLGGVPQRVGLDSRGRGFSLTVGVPVAEAGARARFAYQALLGHFRMGAGAADERAREERAREALEIILPLMSRP